MPKLTLGERLERTKQRKNKAAQDEAALLKLQENERTRRLIALGKIAAETGIDGLPPAALYACFSRIAKEAQDKKTVAAWEREGGKHVKREADNRVVAIAKFRNKIAPEISASLRSLGFRWNRLLVQWEGKVDYPAAKKAVETAGGKIAKVKGQGA